MISITQAIFAGSTTLSACAPYISLGFPFDMHEKEQLTSLSVDRREEYSNFGALDCLEEDLGRFFAEIGNAAEKAQMAARTVNRFVKASIAGLETDTAWITVRSFKPTAEFDLPRWHTDGYYYAPYEGEQRKIVLTLKGPGTLFNLLPEVKRSALRELARMPRETPDRAQAIEQTVNSNQTIQALLHEAHLYIVGSDNAAVHSEPPIHEDRLFMSIVPGRTSQITELRERWEAKITKYAA